MYVGIAGDELLKKKKHAELLEDFDARAAAVVAFLGRCRPSLAVTVSALLDPKAPPKAATISAITCLVISIETVAGATKLIQMRAENLGTDAPKLDLVTVGLVGAQTQDADAPKLGSSELRRREADARS